MEFTDITIKMPAEAARYVAAERNRRGDLRAQALLLYPAIADMKISHGRAAEMLGIGKWQFLDLLASMGIPYITQTWEEVQQDIANYEAALQKEREKAAAV